jgi:hypothetical protein
MTMLAQLLPCITRQRPGVDTIRDDGAAEREVVRCYGFPDFVFNAFDGKTRSTHRSLDSNRSGASVASSCEISASASATASCTVADSLVDGLHCGA